MVRGCTEDLDHRRGVDDAFGDPSIPDLGVQRTDIERPGADNLDGCVVGTREPRRSGQVRVDVARALSPATSDMDSSPVSAPAMKTEMKASSMSRWAMARAPSTSRRA